MRIVKLIVGILAMIVLFIPRALCWAVSKLWDVVTCWVWDAAND